MTEESLLPFDLPAVRRKKVTAGFDGGLISSDGGVVLLREAERRLRLAETLAGSMRDRRDPATVVHTLPAMLRFRMFAIACGYEDADDCDALRTDPLFKPAVGRAPESGRALCSQPTMSRLENAPSRIEVARMTAALVDLFCRSFPTPPAAITLDIDDTCDPVHGHQQLSLFHVHYDTHYDTRCFLPVHVYHVASGKPVAVLLRPGKTPSGAEIRTLLKHLVRRIRRHWPRTRLTFRGDSHYGRTEAMAWCEDNGVDYIFGLAGNSVLHRLSYEVADDLTLYKTLVTPPAIRYRRAHGDARRGFRGGPDAGRGGRRALVAADGGAGARAARLAVSVRSGACPRGGAAPGGEGRPFPGGFAEVAARQEPGQAQGGRRGGEGGPPRGEERAVLPGGSGAAGEAPFASRRRVEQAQHDHVAAHGSLPVARSLAGIAGPEECDRAPPGGGPRPLKAAPAPAARKDTTGPLSRENARLRKALERSQEQKDELVALRRKVAALRRSKRAAQASPPRASARLRKALERTRKQKDTIKALRGEVGSLNRETRRLNRETRRLNRETRRLNRETRRLNRETRRLNRETRRLNRETRRLNRETRRLNRETRRLNRENGRLRRELEPLQGLKKTVRRLSGEAKLLRGELAGYHDQMGLIALLTRRVDYLAIALSKSAIEKEGLEAELADRPLLPAVFRRLRDRDKTIASLRKANERLGKKIRVLRARNARLEAWIAKLRTTPGPCCRGRSTAARARSRTRRARGASAASNAALPGTAAPSGPCSRRRRNLRSRRRTRSCAPVAESPMSPTASDRRPSSRSRSRPTSAGSSVPATAGVATARPRPWK